MFLKYLSFLSLLIILTLVLLIYLQLDFNIKKTNSDIYKLTKSFNYELDENLSLSSRIQFKKSLKEAYENSSQSLSMIRPVEILNIEVAN
jgi:sortase (surface protein transpeptidase)